MSVGLLGSEGTQRSDNLTSAGPGEVFYFSGRVHNNSVSRCDFFEFTDFQEENATKEQRAVPQNYRL